ncbi:MAG: alkaline phosphatase [Clostridia bacterium]|nr:alkaline phosphatase [Clostridia bacterium]
MKKLFSIFLCLIVLLSTVVGCKPQNPGDGSLGFGNVQEVKNIILLIGDGMGPEQIKAGNLVQRKGLYLDKLPNKVLVETRSNDGEITDSAAAGTALATGVRTNNGYVGLDPEGNQLETIVDIASNLGKRTGIITTEDLIGATPMAFASHNASRSAYNDLALVSAQSSNVNLFLSTGNIMGHYTATGGYKIVENVDSISESTEEKIIGAFPIAATAKEGTDFSFDRMVTEALDYLSKDEDGFFLMAEGAHIDHGGHENNIMYMLRELVAFDLGVKAAVEWASKRNDTVVLVTADHETGGLSLANGANASNLFDIDGDGNFTNIRWSTDGHSSADVYLYLYGMEMNYVEKSSFESNNRLKNIDIFNIMKGFLVD